MNNYKHKTKTIIKQTDDLVTSKRSKNKAADAPVEAAAKGTNTQQMQQKQQQQQQQQEQQQEEKQQNTNNSNKHKPHTDSSRWWKR